MSLRNNLLVKEFFRKCEFHSMTFLFHRKQINSEEKGILYIKPMLHIYIYIYVILYCFIRINTLAVQADILVICEITIITH